MRHITYSLNRSGWLGALLLIGLFLAMSGSLRSSGQSLEPTPTDDGFPKVVMLCHVPPGNPANAQMLNISVNGLAAH